MKNESRKLHFLCASEKSSEKLPEASKLLNFWQFYGKLRPTDIMLILYVGHIVKNLAESGEFTSSVWTVDAFLYLVVFVFESVIFMVNYRKGWVYIMCRQWVDSSNTLATAMRPASWHSVAWCVVAMELSTPVSLKTRKPKNILIWRTSMSLVCLKCLCVV